MNNKENKGKRKKENNELLKNIMDVGAALAIKSKYSKFNKIIKDKANY